VRPEPYGCGPNPAGSLALVGGAPTPGASVTLAVDNPVGTQAAGSIPLLVPSLAPDPSFPCGTLVPGWSMLSPAAPGELLIDVGPPTLPLLVGAPWTGPGVPVPIEIPIPDDASLTGITLYFQGLLYDPTFAFGIEFGLAGALAFTVGD